MLLNSMCVCDVFTLVVFINLIVIVFFLLFLCAVLLLLLLLQTALKESFLVGVEEDVGQPPGSTPLLPLQPSLSSAVLHQLLGALQYLQ